MLHVIDEGNERIPAVSGDHDVARCVEDGDAVGGRMGLDIAAVGLRLEPCAQLGKIMDEAIEPRPISITAPGKLPSGHSSEATIVCIHVVPHLGGAQTKMSPWRW